jgi:hypothetical protein
MSKKTLNEANLEALGAGRLAHLLIEVSTGSAEIKRRLRLELSHSLGPEELARDVQKRLTSIRRSTSFVGWRKRKALIKDKCDKVKQLENMEHGKGKFPKKGGKSVDPAVMELRKEGFNVWLQAVMNYYGENLNVCAFFKEVSAIKRDVGLTVAPPEGVPPTEPVRSCRAEPNLSRASQPPLLGC